MLRSQECPWVGKSAADSCPFSGSPEYFAVKEINIVGPAEELVGNGDSGQSVKEHVRYL